MVTKSQRLAKAAPKMLKALKALVEDERPCNWNDISTIYPDDCRQTIKNWSAAEEAIELAEGRG